MISIFPTEALERARGGEDLAAACNAVARAAEATFEVPPSPPALLASSGSTLTTGKTSALQVLCLELKLILAPKF